MGKIFYTENSNQPSETLVRHILKKVYGLRSPEIARTENGKPYLKNISGLFFSVSHTKEKLFITFSNSPIGLDAELLARKLDYTSILKKFPNDERKEILNTEDFLQHWTARESAIKYLGGTLAHDLRAFSFTNKILFYQDKPLCAFLKFFTFEEHVLAICSKEPIENAEFVPISTL